MEVDSRDTDFALPTLSMPSWADSLWQKCIIWLCDHPAVLARAVGSAGDRGEAMLGGLSPGGQPTPPMPSQAEIAAARTLSSELQQC